MKRPKQKMDYRCECGQLARVEPETAYEFSWWCLCGRFGTISWSHAADPPELDAEAEADNKEPETS